MLSTDDVFFSFSFFSQHVMLGYFSLATVCLQVHKFVITCTEPLGTYVLCACSLVCLCGEHPHSWLETSCCCYTVMWGFKGAICIDILGVTMERGGGSGRGVYT